MDNPAAIIVYDLETTGLEPRYDQPVQFAAVRLDGDLREVDAVEFAARPQNHILPAPGALTTHGLGLRTIQDAPLSHCALMTAIEGYAAASGPAVWAGYNSIRFDEEFLRHSLYCALRQPYMTQYGGNTRADVMKLAQLAAAIQPDSIQVPIVLGKPVYKLAALAAANGCEGHDAHDALSDVRATAHLLRHIKAKAPAAWKLFGRLSSKAGVIDVFRETLFAIEFQHIGKTGTVIARPVLPVCANPDYPSEWFCIDLGQDAASLARLSPAALAASFSGRASPLRRIRINAMPMIVPSNVPGALGRVPANTVLDAFEHARQLCSDPSFPERVIAAAPARRDYFPEEYVEGQLYQGGFFPLLADELRCRAFHEATPGEKLTIVTEMDDHRARELGLRIIFNESPNVLPSVERARFAAWRVGRFFKPDVPWMTVPKALAEIAKLTPVADPQARSILLEYEDYLRSLAGCEAAE